jgi:hypothetical protein
MSRIINSIITYVVAAAWIFTAVVAFQAGGTQGDLSLFWFEPRITFALILAFFLITFGFYFNENRKRKLAE